MVKLPEEGTWNLNHTSLEAVSQAVVATGLEVVVAPTLVAEIKLPELDGVIEIAPQGSSLAGADTATPDCVTPTVRVSPPPVTVIVPLRELVPVLAWQLTVTLLFPEPEAGLTDNQLSDSDTVQLVLELIDKALFSPPAIKFSVVGETSSENDTPDCVTVTSRVIPHPVIVNLALRDWASVFAKQLTETVRLPVPSPGETLNQLASQVMTQGKEQLVVLIEKEEDDAEDPNGKVVALTVSVGASEPSSE